MVWQSQPWLLLCLPILTQSLSPSSPSRRGDLSPSSPYTTAADVCSPKTSSVASKKTKSTTTISSLNQEALKLRKFPRTWVPLASTYELDPNRPSPLEFLGQKYVCYRDNNQQWVVMDDSCPHRLAPLSEGRVNRESNSLQCSYHGWEFNSNGCCIRIPQAPPKIEKAGLASIRSCVASYPVFIEKNVIWFWPWLEDVLSVVGELSKHPEGFMIGADLNPSTYTRDLPYGWDSLVENLIDPSHVPFAHHGLQGKRDDAIPINMTVPVSLGEGGFHFEWQDRTMGMLRAGVGMFRAPFSVHYDAKFASDTPRDFKLSVLCIPTKPGWSRAIILGPSMEEPNKISAISDSNAASRQPKKKMSKSSSLMRLAFKCLPVWVAHQFSNRFLDSDLAFLHYQGQERQRRNLYFMPSPADRCIAALRSWVPKYTDIHKQHLPSALSRSEMFDRWSQHTSNCIHCQQGLKTLQKIRRSAYAMLALSVLGFKYSLARLTSILCLGSLRIVDKIERSFMEGEFKHYENH